MVVSYVLLTHLPLDKMADISQTHFLERKYLNLKLNFNDIGSLGSYWHYANISSDDGLAPSGRPLIIWTNADPVQRSINAALEEMSWSVLPINPYNK